MRCLSPVDVRLVLGAIELSNLTKQLVEVKTPLFDQLIRYHRHLLGNGRVAKLPSATRSVTGSDTQHQPVTLPGDQRIQRT